MTDTEKKIAEIREALEKATPGPWAIEGKEIWKRAGWYFGDNPHVYICDADNPANAHLIANAPEWLRFLLSELEKITEQVAGEETKKNESLCDQLQSAQQEIDRLRVLYEQERKSSDTWKRYAETLADREEHWVSVGDELPGKGEVFVYLGGPSTKPGRAIAYHFGDGYFVIDDYYNPRVEVTHWMPLPEPPREGG